MHAKISALKVDIFRIPIRWRLHGTGNDLDSENT